MIQEKLICIPKGSMCMSCVNRENTEFCASLDFDSMPKISKGDSDGYVVKCTEYRKPQ